MVLVIEDLFLNWAFNNIPTIGVCVTLIIITGWLMLRIAEYRYRFIKVESDTADVKKDRERLSKVEVDTADVKKDRERLSKVEVDTADVKKDRERLSKIEVDSVDVKKDRQRLTRVEVDTAELKKDVKALKKTVRRIDIKLTHVEHKLDKLITHLTATRKLDFKD
jgi:hypothetical protein